MPKTHRKQFQPFPQSDSPHPPPHTHPHSLVFHTFDSVTKKSGKIPGIFRSFPPIKKRAETPAGTARKSPSFVTSGRPNLSWFPPYPLKPTQISTLFRGKIHEILIKSACDLARAFALTTWCHLSSRWFMMTWGEWRECHKLDVTVLRGACVCVRETTVFAEANDEGSNKGCENLLFYCVDVMLFCHILSTKQIVPFVNNQF